MHKRQEIQQKSRLGVMLMNKGLISRERLDQALSIQSKTGMRLSEVMINQGWVTELQINRSLKKQSCYPFVAAIAAIAAIAAMLFSPVQPFMAASATDKDTHAITEQFEQASPAERIKGLTTLDDESLGDITAKGSATPDYSQLLDFVNAGVDLDSENGAESIKNLTNLFAPVTNMLDADVEISDVKYGNGPRTQVHSNGSIALVVPTHIGQIAFKNLRIKCSNGSNGSHMGNLYINDIDLSDTNVSIHTRN